MNRLTVNAIFTLFVTTLASTLFVGCASKHEEGVTSSYRSQWTDVMADTKMTTDAAKDVLMSEGLKDVSGSATNVDGKAMGKKADGTKVNVTIEKKTDTSSQVSVTVGTIGDPALGAEIARKIKDKAEMK